MTALHSARYLAGSKGQSCKFQIPGVCTGDFETTVPAHIRDRHTGKAQKASDLSVSDSCHACHDVFDRRARMPDGNYISDEDWHFYALRGLQDTLEGRRAAGLLFVPEDAPKPFHSRATKPRKPTEERRKVPAGRAIQSRPFDKSRSRKMSGAVVYVGRVGDHQEEGSGE